MIFQPPPSYSTATWDTHAPADLPPYEYRPPPSVSDALVANRLKEFSAALKRKGQTIAELTLLANPVYSTTVPTFVEGMPVAGRINLKLDDKPQSIQEVTLTIKGSLVVIESTGEQHHFLNLPTRIWALTMGTPPSAFPSPSPTTEGPRTFSSHSFGDFSWPFSIDLPREVAFSNVTSPTPNPPNPKFKLPQTFMERHARASICYEALLHVRRTKFKADYRVSLNFGYIPLTRPGAPSLLRQLAYQEERTILSPELDPTGWYSAPPIHISGRVLGRHVELECTVSLATPLTYTRGTALPLSILLTSSDNDALDLLSSPRSIVARLRRTTRYQANRHGKNSWKDANDDSQLACWWSCEESGANTSRRRRINGEIHLPKDLKPTTAIGGFRIEYAMVLLPFDDIVFSPNRATASREALVSVPVEIATTYAPGPKPKMYAPPSYESTDTQRFRPRPTFAYRGNAASL